MALNQFIAGFMPRKKFELDEGILARNNILMLTLDERWNSLFAGVERTPAIMRLEDALNQLMKSQARLTAEQAENQSDKKMLLARIMELTEEAFTNENAQARSEIESCEAKVRQINERAPKIEDELAALGRATRKGNMDLLESAVMLLYPSIHDAHARIAVLEAEIESLREKLISCISEKEALAATYNEAYQFMHGLLGADQIEALDSYFSL